jgi:hypothetical protein
VGTMGTTLLLTLAGGGMLAGALRLRHHYVWSFVAAIATYAASWVIQSLWWDNTNTPVLGLAVLALLAIGLVVWAIWLVENRKWIFNGTRDLW